MFYRRLCLATLLAFAVVADVSAPAQTVITNGSAWRWRPGTTEASTPVTAWRTNGFNDSTWAIGTTPFSYGTNSTGRDDGVTSGTVVSGMIHTYSCIFLRRTFVVTNVAEVQSLNFTTYYDDGFVAWINGTPVLQPNMATDSPAYNSFAQAAHEADPAVQLTAAGSPQSYLVPGTNVIAVQLFNNQINSSDLRFETTMAITKNIPLAIASVAPTGGGNVSALTQIAVTFSTPVIGVDAGDFLVNGIPAAAVIGTAPTNTYVFTFTQPPPGLVSVGWDDLHGITDLNGHAFDAGAPGATWSYNLADTVPPQVSDTTPAAGLHVSRLTQVEVNFTEPVQGVDAADLLVNGLPATNVVGSGAGPYVFQFPQPAAGPVQFTWAAGNGITDLATVPNVFAGGSWINILDPAYGLPTVRINEFLASNVNPNGLRDEFGNLDDWIELYNYGANPVDLNGCALTDDASVPGKWVFPSVTLAPNQYLVVFASGLDRKTVGGTNKLHTSFSLSTGGEYLGLYNAESPRVAMDEFAPAYPEQRDDYSYGRDPANALRYFSVPTPGAANGGSSITGVVAAVHFTVGRGFFNQPFNVLLTTPTPGATIRYTTNGTPPTETSGAVFNGKLAVNTTTTLRAAAFAPDLLPTLVQTHTYIFPADVIHQPANPPGFPTTGTWAPANSTWPPDYAMDPRVVTNDATIQGDLMSVPALSIVMKTDDMFSPATGLYTHPGTDGLEAPCSMELIYPDGSSGVQLDAGIEIHGGGSRTSPMKHPFGLKFRGKYGYGKLKYQFFPDSPVAEFNSLVLRSDYNNSWTHALTPYGSDSVKQRARGSLVRDAFFKDMQAAMGDFSSHANYVQLYINGLYWGLYDPCETPDNDFAASYFGGDGDDYDSVRWGDGATYGGDPNHVAYNTMLSFNNSSLASAAQYAQIQQYLDVTQYADYLILQIYGANEDWGATKNWAAVRQRAPGAQFKYLTWDDERTLENTNDSVVSTSPNGLQANLMLNADYKILFADRVHKHLFNDGALTPGRVAQLWLARANQIDRAIVGESARWGDAVPNGKVAISPLPYPGYTTNEPYTREENWLGEQGRLLTNYFPVRTAIVLSQLRSKGYYPAIDAPEFNQHGGRVAPGFNLTIAASAGVIYFTTNGIDPRVSGSGAVSPSAQAYSAALTLNTTLTVKARALSGGTWSALNEAAFTVGELGVPLRVTEIMYNPVGGSQYEFLEVQNIGALPLDVSGFTFQGITYTFPSGTIIQPGAVLLLANNASPAQFAARYPGVSVFGYYGGNLDNGGERIAILDAKGNTVTAVHYDDEAGWPAAADGGGYSLEVIDPRGDPNAPANWRASSTVNGTPGLPPVAPPANVVVISEIAAENHGSVTNGGLFPDWIELQNRGAAATNLAGWSLSDSSDARKFVLPVGTTIDAGGFLVLWCDSATNASGLHTGFALGKSGETVSLFDAETNRVDAITFGLQLADLTVGRVGNDWQLTVPTPGATNIVATLAGSTNVAINEWLADPAAGDPDWLELFNRSSNAPVALRGLYLSTSNALFQIGSLSFIPPRGYVQMFADEQAGADQLEFKLPSAGGMIALSDSTGVELERVTYGAQATAVSQGRLPDGSANIATFNGSASPGSTNHLPVWNGPLLNEVLARNHSATVSPWGSAADFVELFNPGASNFDLAGMALGNSANFSKAWKFPAGTSIGAGGYLLVWCDGSSAASTNSGDPASTGFSLPGSSGDVYLFDPSGQPVDSVSYGIQVQDLSIGRMDGNWQLLAAPTPGAVNAAAAALGDVAALRVNEWMAAPLTGDDWFELYNPNPLPVDLSGLYLTDDPSTAGITKSPVAPLSFIGAQRWAEFDADGHPGNGRDHVKFSLDQKGETIRIYDTNLALIDAVDFGQQTAGVSQGRLPDGGTNIVSFPTTPSPGAANFLPPVDTDGDGLPDDWEIAHGTDPLVPDADADPDHDGMSNWQEYLAGTDPQDPLSVLKLDATITSPGTVTLQFQAVSNHTYGVLYQNSLAATPWLVLTNVASRNTNWTAIIVDPAVVSTNRFYRLVTPQ
jgi:hypothetical protein